jgi:hypothetical protein
VMFTGFQSQSILLLINTILLLAEHHIPS